MAEYQSPALAQKHAMLEAKPEKAAPYYMRCEWFNDEGGWCRLAAGHGGVHEFLKAAAVPEFGT